MQILLPKNFVAALSGMALLFAAGTSAQDAAHSDHAAHAQSTQATTTALPAGQRWATDAPLRDGMRRIREAVQALGHAEHGHLDSAQMANVAKLIDAAVQDMIANCKLKPDADAALHGLLAKFIAGAHAARTGQGVPAALADMRGALARYPHLFDDPDWDASAP